MLFLKIVWILTFLSVVFLDVDVGLIIGIGVSIFSVVVNDQFFNLQSLSHRQNSEDDLAKSKVKSQQNCKMLKIESSVYFANCKTIKKRLFKEAGFDTMEDIFEAQKNANQSNGLIKENGKSSAENKLELEKLKKNKARSKFIIDFSAVNYIDTNGVKMILDVIENLKKADVFVYICSPQGD